MKQQCSTYLADFKHNEEKEYETDQQHVLGNQTNDSTIKCVTDFDEQSSSKSD